MRPRVVTDGPHTMKPYVCPLCRGRMHSGRWRSPGLRPSLAYRQNLVLSLKARERHFTLQSILSRHQSSCAWRCHGVSGSLVWGTRDLSSAASTLFSMVPGRVTTCPVFGGIVLEFNSLSRIPGKGCLDSLFSRPKLTLKISIALPYGHFFHVTLILKIFDCLNSKSMYRRPMFPCEMLIKFFFAVN